ncbi:MAG: hypothetical protein QOF90_3743, partial [Acetobacteraceae bacterium]|nr:hypothetical protein [Acetobacteraceae bacterium]
LAFWLAWMCGGAVEDLGRMLGHPL